MCSRKGRNKLGDECEWGYENEKGEDEGGRQADRQIAIGRQTDRRGYERKN